MGIDQKWILALDTASENLGVALWNSQTDISFVFSENVFRKQASLLHPTIQNLMEQAGITAKDLSAIVVTKGPGSYTGIRVSMAAAQGFQMVLNMPIVTLSTLEVLVQEKGQAGAVYARGHSGMVYKQEFDDNLKPVTEAEFVKSEQDIEEFSPVNPLVLAQLGYARLQQNSDDINNMQPLYVSKLAYRKVGEK